MMDRAAVLEALKELCASADELNGRGAIIDFACACVSARLKEEAYGADPRAVFLAAALANYVISCSEAQSAGFDSFTAGDVTLSSGTGATQSAQAVLAQAEKNAAGIIDCGAFDFKAM